MNKTIFIADDSPTILSYLENVLGQKNNDLNLFDDESDTSVQYDIQTFEDGEYLLQKYKECYNIGKKVPLCILDMRMIRLDGLTTAKEIRKIDRNTKIIIVTAYSDISSEEIKNQLDNDVFYIKKPFNEEEVSILVQTLIKSWNYREEWFKLKEDNAKQIQSLKRTNKKFEQKLYENELLIKNLNNEIASLKSQNTDLSALAENPKKLKTSFLLNMSHEIRTPMNAIVGFSDLLGDPDLTDDQREEFIDLISNSGNDLLNLVDDIVDISRIDAGSFTITSEKVELIELIEELASHFNDELADRKINRINVNSVIEISEKESNILTNEFRLKQIFRKLFVNSLKYTKEGNIQIGVKRKDRNFLLFYLKDNGLGISQEKQSQIFDLFSEFDDSYTKKYGGNRTSMHLAKSLCELLGGRMWIESDVEQGSTYYFTLPHHTFELKQSTSKKSTRPEKGYNWQGKNILIAEDVEFNYMYLEEIIQKTKANILWAKNGQEALYIFDNNPKIDLVLMDIQMPVMNGFEATKEIKKRSPETPVIIQTAYTIDEERQKSQKAGCNDFLTKPIKPADLYRSISKFFT